MAINGHKMLFFHTDQGLVSNEVESTPPFAARVFETEPMREKTYWAYISWRDNSLADKPPSQES